MSIVAADIIAYGSANMPEADGTATGGAISLTTLVVFDSATLANTLNDTLEILSSNAGDTTQTVTITGRNAGGVIVTDPISLNGTTVVAGAVTFERILKIVVSASHAGTITVRKTTGDTTLVLIPTGILTVRRPFYDIAADASGGSSRNFYEKVFLKNTHATLSLTNAAVIESADPSGNTVFALANTKDDTESTANRQTAPSAVTAFDGTSKSVEDTFIAAGEAIGVWLRLTLAAGTAAAKTTYTLGLNGTTT